MLWALSGLTTRGRCFLAAGLAAVVCAVLLGQRDLLRVGILLAALPVIAMIALARTRVRVSCSRELEPARIPAGDQARVTLRLENVSLLPTGLLLVEDQIPYLLGGRPRFVLDRVRPRGRREVSYPVHCDLRGEYPIGPVTLRLADPFGMCELSRSFRQRDALIVTPAIHPLTDTALGRDWTGNGDGRPRSVAAAGEDDVAVREYRDGDALHRVHWRSTARRGELMVRREEQPWHTRATVLLDTRALAHTGDGPDSSFEWGVSAAASVAMHLLRQGYAVRLVTDVASDVDAVAPDIAAGGDAEGLLLDALAVVSTSPADSLSEAFTELRRSTSDGLIVAVLGELSSELAEDLARLRHGTTKGIAVLLDTGSWTGTRDVIAAHHAGKAHHRAALLLRSGGWEVRQAAAGHSLAEVWSGATTPPPAPFRPEPVPGPVLETS